MITHLNRWGKATDRYYTPDEIGKLFFKESNKDVQNFIAEKMKTIMPWKTTMINGRPMIDEDEKNRIVSAYNEFRHLVHVEREREKERLKNLFPDCVKPTGVFS